MAFLAFAVVILVTSVLLARKGCGKSSDTPISEQPQSSADLHPLDTPAPVTADSVIAPGVTINGVSVGNLTVADAKEKVIAALEAEKSSVDITVAYESYEPLALTAETIGLGYTDEDLEAALASAARGTEAVKVPMTFSPELLRNALYELNDKIPNHAVNAQAEVKYKSKTIDNVTYYQPYWSFTDGVNGAKIDFDVLEKQVSDAINSRDYTASLTPTVTVSEPEITVDALKAQLTLLSSYQTNYATKAGSSEPELDENNRNRDKNITKAVSMMQVVALEPGKTFDFNRTTGERSEKKVWALANAVYQGNTYRKEPGGGVCQVSTTIFNAVLRAGITNITRKGHSIPSNYVTKDFEEGLGFDATVDYPDINFKFKNDTGHTIYMFVYITKNNSRRKNINVEIYGQQEPGVTYKVYNEILEKTPYNDESRYEYEYDKNTLASAKAVLLRSPHDGYKVKTYVDKYQDGKFVKTVRTEETVYKVIYPKYRVGTAVITPAPTNTPKPTATPKPTDPPIDSIEP